MADIKLRLPLGVTGWTVYTRLKNESGQIWQTTTSTYVTYVVADVANYALATPETPASSGDYEATMPTGSAAGNYSWAHYKRVGGSAAISDPFIGGGGGWWNGSTFGLVQTVSASEISVADIVVADSAPTTLSFVIAMADNSDVPETFTWRGGLACFAEDSATLPNGKFPIATYTRITTTTARITFSPALPVAPADAEAIQVL